MSRDRPSNMRSGIVDRYVMGDVLQPGDAF